MAFMLGAMVQASGCVTRLVDIVNRSPAELEDLVGFHRGRLSNGFCVLLLKQALGPSDFEFFGYTYMSGGRIGLPSNVPAIDRTRPKVDDLLRARFGGDGPQAAPGLYEQFARRISLIGPERYAKVVSAIGHDETMPMADQYPASKKGVAQLNIKRASAKNFLVAAEIKGPIWTLADPSRTQIDVKSPPRYDQPYANEPRRKIMDFLANA